MRLASTRMHLPNELHVCVRLRKLRYQSRDKAFLTCAQHWIDEYLDCKLLRLFYTAVGKRWKQAANSLLINLSVICSRGLLPYLLRANLVKTYANGSLRTHSL